MKIVIVRYNSSATVRVFNDKDTNEVNGIEGYIDSQRTRLSSFKYLESKKEAEFWLEKYKERPFGDEYWGFHHALKVCFKQAFDIDVDLQE